MPRRIIPVLDRLRQDAVTCMSKETIEAACRHTATCISDGRIGCSIRSSEGLAIISCPSRQASS